ncbi:MAG: hypothetical protein ACE5IF_03530 [Candidatus Bathyarchaeia archaeon]
MTTAWKVFGVSTLVFLFFSLMSRIDFIVHSTLYNYGLQFSYQWANEYWIAYCAVFFSFSLLIGFMYWLGSNKNKRDRKISLALTTTVNLLTIAGTADLMMFLLWAGRLPPENVIWWWTPWYQIFGVWTSSLQLAFATMIFLIMAFVLVQTLKAGTRIRRLVPAYSASFDSTRTADPKSLRSTDLSRNNRTLQLTLDHLPTMEYHKKR